MGSLKGLLALGLSLFLAVPSVAKAPEVLAERDRDVVGVRPVQVVLAQSQIETNIELGMIPPAANGGGALAGIIIASMDDRAKQLSASLRTKADADAAPLRAALSTMDIGALAVTTTRNALQRTAWFKPGAVTLSKTPDQVTDTPAGQRAELAYRYSLSPDFTRIQVVVDVVLARSEGASRRAVPIYAQRLSSVVQLARRSYEQHENAMAWAANDGEVTKQAVTFAFDRLEGLLSYALAMNQADLDAVSAKGGDQVFAGGFYGRRIRRDADQPGDVLLWSNGLIPRSHTGKRAVGKTRGLERRGPV